MRRPCSSHVYQVSDTPGEQRDLLAPQPGRAPVAGAAGQPDLLGRDGVAAGAQELGQLGTVIGARVGTPAPSDPVDHNAVRRSQVGSAPLSRWPARLARAATPHSG